MQSGHFDGDEGCSLEVEYGWCDEGWVLGVYRNKEDVKGGFEGGKVTFPYAADASLAQAPNKPQSRSAGRGRVQPASLDPSP